MAVARRLVSFTYILKDDREAPEERQTQFHLRPLTYKEQEQISPSAVQRNDDMEITISPMTMARKVLNFALEGWDNFCDQDGNPVEFERANEQPPAYGGKNRRAITFIPDHLFDLLTPYALELTNAITDRSDISEDLGKNSG